MRTVLKKHDKYGLFGTYIQYPSQIYEKWFIIFSKIYQAYDCTKTRFVCPSVHKGEGLSHDPICSPILMSDSFDVVHIRAAELQRSVSDNYMYLEFFRCIQYLGRLVKHLNDTFSVSEMYTESSIAKVQTPGVAFFLKKLTSLYRSKQQWKLTCN